METGLLDAALKMYRNASGNVHFSIDDVRYEFSRLVIDKPLLHNSPYEGKVASSRHILEGEMQEASVEELLAEA